MSIVLLILLASVIVGIGAIMIYRRQKKPKRIIREGKRRAVICGEGGFQGLARMYSFFLSDFRKTGSGPYHR